MKPHSLPTALLLLLALTGCTPSNDDDLGLPFHPQEERIRAGQPPILDFDTSVAFPGYEFEFSAAIAQWELPPNTHAPILTPWKKEWDDYSQDWVGQLAFPGAGWADGDSMAFCLWLGEWLNTRTTDPGRSQYAVNIIVGYEQSWEYQYMSDPDSLQPLYQRIFQEALLDAPKAAVPYFWYNCSPVHDQYPAVTEAAKQHTERQ